LIRTRIVPFVMLPLAVVSALALRADDRSTEILRYECLTDSVRRETTLFANGTIRLRRGRIGNEYMGLAELGQDALQGYVNRLSQEDLTNVTSPVPGPEGAWVEHCSLRLQLPGKELKSFDFGPFDPLQINFAHVLGIAQELEKKVKIVKDKDELPADYDPRPGDVLKRIGDGLRFRIVAFTGDEKGIELEGIDQPLEIYIAKGEVRKKFTTLVSREP
jgi:hypothetical protein